MKISTILVLLVVLYVANSKELDSTMQGQFRGKMIEVESDSALPHCIAYIFNYRREQLGIGVIDQNLNIITNLAALRGNRKLTIHFMDRIDEYRISELTTYGGYLIEIKLQLPPEDDSMDRRRFAPYFHGAAVPQYYQELCPVAVAVGWDEETPFKKKEVLIHNAGRKRIITKPRSTETVYFVGRIGDPLFVDQQLVGILIRPENISRYAIYENMWGVFNGARQIIYP